MDWDEKVHKSIELTSQLYKIWYPEEDCCKELTLQKALSKILDRINHEQEKD